VTTLLVLLLAAQAAPPAKAADCTALKSLQLPDVTITDATPSGTSAIKVNHCLVEGVVGKEIRFRLLLPDDWNRKFMMGGGGGFVGSLDNQALASLNAGYATVGTDTGHQAGLTSAGWALNNPERLLNFGHVAVHRVAEVSKTIISRYYAAPIARSYFNGCSNGGRQALMEAQRYPDDFDGIVAGAPAADFTGIGAQFIKDMQALFPDPKNLAPPFTAEVMKGLESQIVEKCDAIDGVKDGLIDDPRKCRVDVSTLARLTDDQKTVLKRIYGETRNKDGVIAPGQPFGGEGEPGGWAGWIVGPNTFAQPSLRYAFGTEMFKHFIFGDPAWDYSRYDFANYRKESARAGSLLNATNPDLAAFKKSSGKLIIWHGWSDAALTAYGSINYYEQVVKRNPSSRDFVRMFMLPGVLHCAGGPGPDRVDWFKTIDEWVEKGVAPERIVATKAATPTTPARTRPLCAYPLRAVYKGSGSIDDEASFTCGK